MEKLFGTDGIRGKANFFPLNPETAVAVGRALVEVLGNGLSSPAVVIGQDTRQSCDMLACALAAGGSAMGAQIRLAGVVPTPAVAFLARSSDAVAGVVVSASHNPYQDNGIKLFDANGGKLTDEREAAIERRVAAQIQGRAGHLHPPAPGPVNRIGAAEARYLSFLKQAAPAARFLKGVKMVIDCANGATYRVAPEMLRSLGADVQSLSISPDGRNINRDCGSQHLDALRRRVTASHADIGLAFDGDGDRLIAVDESGRPVSGDQILAVCARDLMQKGRLANKVVVATVMSNIGFKLAMERLGIRCVLTDVGDRRVVERMRAEGAVVGGEDSGHTIFLDPHTTGDGMLTALRLLEAMASADRPLSVLTEVMTAFPQVLINVDVGCKPDIESVPQITRAVGAAEAQLGNKGRVLVRYSGTEHKCRVMVEGPTVEATRDICEQIAQVVRECLGQGDSKREREIGK